MNPTSPKISYEKNIFGAKIQIDFFQIFQALEHPVEEEKLVELQNLVIMVLSCAA